MTKEYIQIGKDYRITKMGDNNLYQVWKQINGGGYRKVHLQISFLNKVDFIKTQYILHMIINQFVDRKLSTRGYTVSPRGFNEFQDVTTENILHLASELSSDETLVIFYKTK